MDEVKLETNTEKCATKNDIETSHADSEVEKAVEPLPTKTGDGSEYESAEEDGDKVADKTCEEFPSKDQESLSELVDEEGGEEGIAEPEDVEGEFLSGDQPDEVDGEEADEGNDNEIGRVGDEAEEGNEVEEGEIVEDEVEEGEIVDDEVEEGEIEEGEIEEGDEVDEGDDADEGSEGEYADERQQGDEGSEEGEYVEEERQQGDGEECSPTSVVTEKELDFDEDRRNPQYIPKKGIFYEHDDRNNEDVKEKEEEPSRDRKKKLWLDEGRWGHDRFRLEEQYPKSKHELIETYGYDIRNEDGPPRARRRRRYGRGPTKYDRNWEDVSAYGREKLRGSPRGVSRGRRASGRFRGVPRFRGGGRKEFISEDSDRKDYVDENGKEDEVSAEKESKEIELNDILPIINSNEFPALPSKDPVIESEVIIEKRPFFQKSLSEAPESTSVKTLTFENSNLSGRNSLERDVPSLKGKSVVYGRQHDRSSSQNDRSMIQHERNTHQYEKNMNQHERNTHQYEKNMNQHERNTQYEKNMNQHERSTHQYEKNMNQHERNTHQYEKNMNQHERNTHHYEKNMNQYERNTHQYEKNMNQHDRNTHQFEKNMNQYERRTNQPERNVNYHERNTNQPERNVNYHERNLSHYDRNVSQHERGNRKPIPRGNRGLGRGDHNRRGRGGNMRHISPRFMENRVNNISTEMGQLNIEDVADVCNGINTDKVRQADNDVVPSISSECEITNMSVKGAGDSSSRPKRYSSLRQRSLPETTTYQTSQPTVPSQTPAYYESGYQPTLYAPTNTGVPTPSTQSQSATSPPLMNPSGFHPYDCGIRLQLLPRAIFPQPTIPTGQSVLAPPPPSTCIPAPTPNLMDFAAPPPPPSGYHQYAYQQYAQPPPPPPPTAPNEIYQPGITYYFAQQTQSSSARPTVQKRPKAAIPILPPPEREIKKSEIKEGPHASSNNRNSSIEAANGEVPSLRTDTSSQPQQLPSVGVES